MPTLSICIPTYNRSHCLAELLDSIIAQDMPQIEVVVSDDGSPDDTAALARSYGGRIARFTLLCQPVNIGVDRNIRAVTEAATGDYIWLIGDDDRLEPGGARRVMDALERWPGVVGLTLGVVDYDVTLRHVTGLRAMPRTQRIEGAAAVFSRSAHLLGYISGTVVDRRKWNAASADPSARAMKNLYSPVYILGRAIGATGTWGIVNEPCIGFRSGNDQLKRRVGWLERLKIDVRAYDEIADLLFADDRAAHRAMCKRVFDTHILARIVNATTSGEDSGERLKAATYLIGRYAAMPRLWLLGLPMLLAPAIMLRAVRSAYRRMAGSSGTARARRFVSAETGPAAGRVPLQHGSNPPPRRSGRMQRQFH
ncbi:MULTISPECIES: glycosyltransferase family 2 protein [unclassified Novosphingobium]|uniref:glycosyltransferase family 2 protein n=1 Tax=unclassified Novosphingobium TaxID=2644732 RepID=UPI00135A08D3|nr:MULTISPECIES: glycosyltransferase family 2 protein [unclassified Novosphingobium]